MRTERRGRAASGPCSRADGYRRLPLCWVLPAFLALGACAGPKGTPAGGDDLALLASWMTGSFSSAAQAEADPDFFDIRLKMARIWRERDDGPWLYVEQAAADSLDRPYRQRVYRLFAQDAETLVSEVFELPEPLRYAGAWREQAPLAELSPEDLTTREGAAIFLKRVSGDIFAGSTEGKKCLSNFRGAAYATSEVCITAAAIYSWDRGFDAADQQVWGAVKGGYLFAKLSER